jgi:hypothetical protein
MRALLVSGLAVLALVLVSAAAADPLDPKQKLTPADQARAKAALLRQNDLGTGWTGGASATPSSLKAPVCPSLRPNYSKLTLTGHAESLFSNGNGGIQVVADVEVWKTLAQAKQHMNALLQPKLGACIRYALLKSVGGTNVTILGAQRQPTPKLGDSSAHYRVPLGVKSGNQTVSVLSDVLMVRKGRTEIYLNVVAPADNEDQLTGFVHRLARATLARVRA